MAFSMTGFGKGEAGAGAYKFIVEIRSVNHRYCDISVRTPRMFSSMEERLRQMASKALNRGKIDIYVNYEEHGEREHKISTDAGLAAAYIESAKILKQRFDLSDDVSLSAILRLPGIFQTEDAPPDEEEVWRLLSAAAQSALDALLAMRRSEGEKLISDILTKVRSISATLAQIEERAPYIVGDYREKLNARLAELLGQNVPDENRVAAEIAIFADRCSVDEELTRFRSHLAQAEKCCLSGEPMGRKLDFILQEINREINTIGSKANDLAISEKVVEIKSEAEKIREQIQNLE